MGFFEQRAKTLFSITAFVEQRLYFERSSDTSSIHEPNARRIFIHICTMCSVHLVGVFKRCLMFENAQNEKLQNMEVVTFMFIPCLLNNECLLYTNICTNT